MSYWEEILDKLNLLPPQINKQLISIRNIDKEVEQLKIKLERLREKFLEGLPRWKNNRNDNESKQIEKNYEEIVQLQDEITNKSREKVEISDKIYNLVHQPTQLLEEQLQNLGYDYTSNSSSNYNNKNSRKLKKGRGKKMTNEVRYCYCNDLSYGEMVMCENTYCQRQWFHIDCLDQAELPEKWYCKQCRTEMKKSSKNNSKANVAHHQ